MIIQHLYLKNFRGFADIDIPLDNQFNLIIGDNGSGKTAILEALTVAMGSFFLGIKNTDSRRIRESDIRLRAFEFNEEYQFPVIVSAHGLVGDRAVGWTRELNSLSGSTISRRAISIKRIAEEFDALVRAGESVTLPVLAYYSTGRLWKDVKEGGTKRNVSSRLRAYKSCLQATSTFKLFLKWFRGKELSSIQKRESDISLKVIRDLIKNNLPNCRNIYYEFDEDKIQGLKIEQNDGTILPFEYLSDGTRNLFALLADIAYRCLVLNPHLKESALERSPGIILIDELDLHLHPEWQKQMVTSLKEAFKSIQFITTSHSPFIIQETAQGQLIKLKNNEVLISGGDQLSIEDIAQYKQEVNNPQWSEKKKELYKAAQEYYRALEGGEVSEELELKVSKLIKPFSQNQAYSAFLEQIKLTKKKQ
jgi:predicted ATP-binding protein involved in virulence